MMEKIDKAYLRAKLAMMNKFAEWKEEERGASDIVAVIVVIVIVLAVAAVFQDKLKDLIQTGMQKAIDFFDKSDAGKIQPSSLT